MYSLSPSLQTLAVVSLQRILTGVDSEVLCKKAEQNLVAICFMMDKLANIFYF